MKKTTAILFVLLAIIIIVAHAVVPHHHLSNKVLIITKHHDADDFNHKHHTDKHDHDHEHGDANDYDFCLLKQVISIPTNTSKQEFSSPSIDFEFGNRLAILITNDFVCNPPPILSYLQTSFHSLFYTCFINSVSGLRAPPTV